MAIVAAFWVAMGWETLLVRVPLWISALAVAVVSLRLMTVRVVVSEDEVLVINVFASRRIARETIRGVLPPDPKRLFSRSRIVAGRAAPIPATTGFRGRPNYPGRVYEQLRGALG